VPIYLNYLSYFVILIPAFLVTGPFLPDLIVSVSALFFAIYIIQNRLFFLFNNFFFKLFVVFWIILIFSSLFSVQKLISLKVSIFYIRFGIFVIFICYLLDKNKNFLNNFFYSTIITISVVIFDSYLQYFTGENLIGIPSKVDGGRLTSFFGDELIVGSFIARMFPLLVSFFFLLKLKYNYIYLPLIFFLTDIIVFLSGERTSFGIIIILNILFIIFLKEFKKIRLLTFLISIVTIFILIFNNPVLKNRMIDQTLNEFKVRNFSEPEFKINNNQNFFTKIIEDKKSFFIFTEQHDQHIKTAYNIFLDNKLIGAGPKMFRYLCSDEKYNVGKWSCTTHPHNTHIQLLSETGLIGYSIVFFILILISYLFLILFIKKNIKLSINITDYQICHLSSFLITLFPFIPSGNFFNNWLSIVYFLPVGFYLHAIKDSK
jgi:O-antigen ligase